MRHNLISTTFGRSQAHRRALLARLTGCLIGEKRIVTTLPRAKAVRRFAEKLVTRARRGTLADRRHAASVLRDDAVVRELFAKIAPACQGRSGGYTRIIKMNPRGGDRAAMAILEWVAIAPVENKPTA